MSDLEAGGASAGAGGSTSPPPSSSQQSMEPIKPIKFHADGPPILEADAAAESEVAVALRSGASNAAAQDSAAGTAWLLGEAKQEPLHLRCLPSLSWEDRVMGFLGCYIIGVALGLSAMMSFPGVVAGHPEPFAWKYSAGNVLGLVSTAFLVGPKTQLKSMMAPVRLGATVIYLSSIALTLVAAIVLRVGLLTLLAMVVQYCALLWYSASYIPFGRQCLRGCIGWLFRRRR
eukprot:7387025-Prymnesium_polylepis.1